MHMHVVKQGHDERTHIEGTRVEGTPGNIYYIPGMIFEGMKNSESAIPSFGYSFHKLNTAHAALSQVTVYQV